MDEEKNSNLEKEIQKKLEVLDSENAQNDTLEMKRELRADITPDGGDAVEKAEQIEEISEEERKKKSLENLKREFGLGQGEDFKDGDDDTSEYNLEDEEEVHATESGPFFQELGEILKENLFSSVDCFRNSWLVLRFTGMNLPNKLLVLLFLSLPAIFGGFVALFVALIIFLLWLLVTFCHSVTDKLDKVTEKLWNVVRNYKYNIEANKYTRPWYRRAINAAKMTITMMASGVMYAVVSGVKVPVKGINRAFKNIGNIINKIGKALKNAVKAPSEIRLNQLRKQVRGQGLKASKALAKQQGLRRRRGFEKQQIKHLKKRRAELKKKQIKTKLHKKAKSVKKKPLGKKKPIEKTKPLGKKKPIEERKDIKKPVKAEAKKEIEKKSKKVDDPIDADIGVPKKLQTIGKDPAKQKEPEILKALKKEPKKPVKKAKKAKGLKKFGKIPETKGIEEDLLKEAVKVVETTAKEFVKEARKVGERVEKEVKKVGEEVVNIDRGIKREGRVVEKLKRGMRGEKGTRSQKEKNEEFAKRWDKRKEKLKQKGKSHQQKLVVRGGSARASTRTR